MSPAPDPHPAQPDASASPPPRSWRTRFSGLRLDAEECPEGKNVGVMEVAGGGVAGWVLTAILGGTRSGRLLGAAIGAITATALSRYHLRADWDPDQARASGLSGLAPSPSVQGPDA